MPKRTEKELSQQIEVVKQGVQKLFGLLQAHTGRDSNAKRQAKEVRILFQCEDIWDSKWATLRAKTVENTKAMQRSIGALKRETIKMRRLLVAYSDDLDLDGLTDYEQLKALRASHQTKAHIEAHAILQIMESAEIWKFETWMVDDPNYARFYKGCNRRPADNLRRLRWPG